MWAMSRTARADFSRAPYWSSKNSTSIFFLECLSARYLKRIIAFITASILKAEIKSAVLSQLRVLDAKRLENRMGDLPSHEFERVKEKLKGLMF